MPTDEQRKQFEANFLACSPMSVPSDFTRDSVGGYENDYLQQRWRGWVEGQRACDAEVQALRELLTQVTEELAEEVTGSYKARYGDPIHPAMEGRYARDMDTVYRARKLLAGGEEGEPE